MKRPEKLPRFAYRYQMVMFVMDYAGELDDLTLPLLAWLSENQPQLLLNPERNQDNQIFRRYQ
ncbi:Phage tail completion protein R [Escherichia coli]|nr:Phage tail completion protein R [Escherichia coli]